jgi:pyruvate ferredoxin oxidoreductase alpha subunit
MIKTIEASKAYAETVVNCEPEVVACYPISPSTHIVESLSQAFADGKLKSFITVEAEFSAISVLVGASATGARTFSTTAGQGLLYMHEVLHSASGMRLPIVMLITNRAVSSQLNIWNDEQDSISQRDTGWIQIYCKNNQEAVDSLPQAFSIAEKALLPVMVCVDGYYLTHAVEQINLPEKEKIDLFLPKFNPEIKLDPEKPLSLGVYANPKHYQAFREELWKDMLESEKIILSEGKKFEEIFNRGYGLIHSFKCEDAETIIVGLGSVMDNVISVVEELRSKGHKVGALHLRVFRPFPRKEIQKILSGKTIGVIERNLSLGGSCPVYTEIVEALQGTDSKVSSFFGGLGGKMITRKQIKKIFEKLFTGKVVKEWV